MAAPARVAPAAKPKFTVTQALLGWARRKPAPEQVASIFTPARPYPGVVPQGQEKAVAKMAMDQATLSEGWAPDLVGGIFGEGLVFPGYAYLAELAQRPEYRRVVETIASEMTREWIVLVSVSRNKDKTEKIAQLTDALKRLRIQEGCRRVIELDGFFGRGHLYIDTGDTERPEELMTPIGNGRDDSKAKIKKGSIKAFRPVEPIWTYPASYDSNNPLKPEWYNPNSWFVMGKQVHATRLLTFIGRPVPDILKPAYSFGGLSLTQMAKFYVDKYINITQSIADLVRSFSVSGVKTNLAVLQGINDQAVQNRVELYNQLRDTRGMMLLDKDSEEFFNVVTPLSTLDALQAQAQEHICAAVGMPLIKYAGLTPTGLNASSEGEIRSWYDWGHASQEMLLRRPLTSVIDLVQLSEFGDVDPDITFEFQSLWQLDDAAKAAVQKTKADVHDVYSELGVVSVQEIRRSVAADTESPYAGLDLDAEPPPPPPAPPEAGGARKDPSDPLTERVDSEATAQGGLTSGV